jgi:hypothetical protein
MKAMNAKMSKARLPSTPPTTEGTLVVDDATWGLGVGETTSVTVDVGAVTNGVTEIKSRKIVVVLSEVKVITNVWDVAVNDIAWKNWR